MKMPKDSTIRVWAEILFWASFCGVVLFVLSLLLGIPWVVKSHFEAKTYNRLTGADATTWEAMWVELRVQSEPVRREK